MSDEIKQCGYYRLIVEMKKPGRIDAPTAQTQIFNLFVGEFL